MSEFDKRKPLVIFTIGPFGAFIVYRWVKQHLKKPGVKLYI